MKDWESECDHADCLVNVVDCDLPIDEKRWVGGEVGPFEKYLNLQTQIGRAT